GGHTIRGDGNPAGTPDQVGIRLVVVSNVTVKLGTVRDFNAGILVSQGSSNTISDTTVTANVGTAESAHGDGHMLRASNDSKMLRNKVTSNGPRSGVNVSNLSARTLIQGNSITDNNLVTPPGIENDAQQSDRGIEFDNGATDTTIDGNQLLRNGFEA